jgi:ASC-1-like (ASCH) protein
MIVKLQEVWVTPEVKTWEEHLEDFHESYEKDGDFEKARGKRGCARYQALLKLTNVQDLSTYEEPHRSMIRKLQEVWVTPEVKTWKEHLEDFHESYEKDGDFQKARGKNGCARYIALGKLNKVTDLSKYEEPYRSMISFLQEVWVTPEVKTWEEHLEDFHESYQEDGDFKKARGKHGSARYIALGRLNKVSWVTDLSKYEEPHRSMISFLQEVWEPIKLPVSQEHLTVFFESYKNGGNFDEARGKSDSARYHILKNLNEDNAYTYDEPHQSLILKLQKVWKEHEHL